MSKKPTKKLKIVRTKELGHLLQNWSQVPIDSVISSLQEAKDEGHLTVGLEVHQSGYDSYIDDIVWTASHLSEETDEEFEARVSDWQKKERKSREQAKKRRAAQEEKDRRDFERLSKKYAKPLDGTP